MSESPFNPADLSQYKFSKRLTIQIAAKLIYIILGLIGLTLRWENGIETDDLPSNKRGNVLPNERIIYTFWHNRITAATLFFKKRSIVVMTSQSYDGEIIARIIQLFGYGAARGSATRGSVQALKKMVRCIKENYDVAFTIDGPKGPRYEAKPGAIMLARLTGAAILPMCPTVKNYIEINSWDKFRIPLPFSRARILYGKPIYVIKNANESDMKFRQEELQRSLDQLETKSLKW